MSSSYVSKDRESILRQSLQKLQRKTPVTSIGPGSVARSLTEVVVKEVSDFYDILDFNMSMNLITTARGRALDLMGILYNVERKQLGEVATLDQVLGSFYFYLESPIGSELVIPLGASVYTEARNFVGDEYSFYTTQEVAIPAGRTRVYAQIKPSFTDSVFTVGANSITRHNVELPPGVTLLCTNPKAIAPQVGYESDDNLRVRIINAARTSAGGTSDSIRFSGLAVPGVRDVKVRQTPYGLGTVEALVIPEDTGATSETVVGRAQLAMETVRPVGVRMYVRQPNYVNCDVTGTIVVRKDTQAREQGTRRRAEIAIVRHLNRLLPGEKLIYNQLIQAILEASDAIADISVSQLRIDGTEILRRNYTPESDQQIIPGAIRIASA